MRQDAARQVRSYNNSNGSTAFTAVNEVLNDDELDAELDAYEREMHNEENEMRWGLGDDLERVETCAQRMDRPTPGQSPQPISDNDDCMQDIRYNRDTVSRRKEADDTMMRDAEDGMEEGCDGDEIIAACRGQKRRLHTVCEISYAARSKMIKQLGPGIT